MSKDQSATTIESNWDQEVANFDDMGLRDPLLRAIYAYGFEKPSVIQKRAIMPIIKQRNVLAQTARGAGTTAAFTIGLLQRIDPAQRVTQALVLAPTRELAGQIQGFVAQLGDWLKVDCHVCVGRSTVKEEVETLRSGVHVVVGTPGRVLDMISRGALRPDGLKMFVLDETDEMLSAGFKEQIYDMVQSLPFNVQVLLSSRTMPADVLEMSTRIMRDPVRILVRE